MSTTSSSIRTLSTHSLSTARAYRTPIKRSTTKFTNCVRFGQCTSAAPGGRHLRTIAEDGGPRAERGRGVATRAFRPEILGRPARERHRQCPVEPRQVGDRRHHALPVVEARCLVLRQCVFDNHDDVRTRQKKLPRRFKHGAAGGLQVGLKCCTYRRSLTCRGGDLDRQGCRPRQRRDQDRLARARDRQAPYRLSGCRDPRRFRDPLGDPVGIETLKRRRRDDARRVYAPVRARPQRLCCDGSGLHASCEGPQLIDWWEQRWQPFATGADFAVVPS